MWDNQIADITPRLTTKDLWCIRKLNHYKGDVSQQTILWSRNGYL